MSDRKHPIFTYGTLMSGEYNHDRIAHARFLGEARTALGYVLYDLGPFPALVREGLGSVAGELYEVDDETRAELDRLEGHPRFYCRTLIKLASGGFAETYMLLRNHVRGRPVIESGSWRHRKERLP
jgi:gamma-glutamylaminecyclotransferase